ncbi:hypothetical protein ES288_D12G112000v1 [Gossypium darwinii]|uniref:L-ascorbate oxidase n=1 Tax=Gossypium darwinii TaxID=34276 RepID=A0A5D2A731_GOSDA|nr:hypothetical protein ES288_D12G112000v1 [Gossypium darwinii]
MLLITCIFIFLITIPIAAIKRHYTWEVTYEYKSLDCYKKLAVAINGMTLGPTISAVQGDTIAVDVINNLLMENVAIHWHGIRQRGTPWSDGTGGVTQCAIMPGEKYTYTFEVDRVGTYMYHSHYGMQREGGLYGMINVSIPGVTEPFNYDADHGIILSDWYHHLAYDQSTALSSIPFQWIGEPQSLLINGKGNYNCSGLTPGICNSTNPQCSPSTLTDHEMTIIEADRQYVEPFVTKNLFIYSGETYSVLVIANQDPSKNYWTTINVVTIFNYLPNHFLQPPPTNPPIGPIWNDTNSQLNQSLTIKARKGFIITPPRKPDKIIVLPNAQNTINGYLRRSLNNVSHTLPTTPYLIALKQNMSDVFDPSPPPEDYNSTNFDIYTVENNTNAILSTSIYKLQFNSIVDIILQNANSMMRNVLGYGEGKFNLLRDVEKYNLVDPIMKNTVALHPYGWVTLRFQADNLGVWLFHCHIEAHFFLGMLVVFESNVEKVGDIPKINYGCGKNQSHGLAIVFINL